MDQQEQLAWEARTGRLVAAAAIGSAALAIGAALYLRAKVSGTVNDSVDRLVLFDKHAGPIAVGAVLSGLSTALVAPVLYFLFRATKYRRPELPPALLYAAIAAPLVSGLAGIAYQFKVNSVAHSFVKVLPLPPDVAINAADHQTSTGLLTALGLLGTIGGLGLVIAVVMICVNAMRVGLLSRFMGVLGVIVGILFLLPLQGGLPFVQAFWFAALGLLLLGLWPQGRGPAWATGQAIPWPTAADRRAEMEQRQGGAPPARGRGGRAAPALADGSPDGDAPEPALESSGTATAVAQPTAQQHPRSKKRKRKRK